jgi:hypothetical protein
MVDGDGARLVVNVRGLIDDGDAQPIFRQQIGERRAGRAIADMATS